MNFWRRLYHERRAVILPLVVLIAVNVVLLTLAVFPLAQNVSGLHTDARTASNNMVKARFIDKQAKDAGASKQRADQELKKFYLDVLPGNPTAARKLVSFLQRSAQESGLQFQRSQLDETEVKDSQLQRMSGKVTLIGEYQNFRKFLYMVETAPEFVVVERVALAQAADLRSSTNGQLEVTLDIATYYPAGPPGAQSQ